MDIVEALFWFLMHSREEVESTDYVETSMRVLFMTEKQENRS